MELIILILRYHWRSAQNFNERNTAGLCAVWLSWTFILSPTSHSKEGYLSGLRRTTRQMINSDSHKIGLEIRLYHVVIFLYLVELRWDEELGQATNDKSPIWPILPLHKVAFDLFHNGHRNIYHFLNQYWFLDTLCEMKTGIVHSRSESHLK